MAMYSLEPETEAVLDSLAGGSVDCTLDALASVQLLVQPAQHDPQHERSSDRHSGK